MPAAQLLSVRRLRGRIKNTGLSFLQNQASSNSMSTKQIVQDLLQRLPEDVSLHDVAQELEFISAIRQGEAELNRGERIPIEEVERELPSWIIK